MPPELDITFYFDPERGQPHIYRNGVTEEEVQDVFLSPSVDAPGRHGARLLIGNTGGGRFLRVIYVRGEDWNSYFVITAYEITEQQLAEALLRTPGTGQGG